MKYFKYKIFVHSSLSLEDLYYFVLLCEHVTQEPLISMFHFHIRVSNSLLGVNIVLKSVKWDLSSLTELK